MSEIEIYTDGGSHGNPGPGGWAFVSRIDGELHEGRGGQEDTTNNRMELQAVIEALRFAKRQGHCDRGPVHIYTDSQYVQRGMTEWMKRWVANGWQTANKKPVRNKELWMELRGLASECEVQWHWVRGHAGSELNERSDALVQEAIAAVETNGSS